MKLCNVYFGKVSKQNILQVNASYLANINIQSHFKTILVKTLLMCATSLFEHTGYRSFSFAPLLSSFDQSGFICFFIVFCASFSFAGFIFIINHVFHFGGFVSFVFLVVFLSFRGFGCFLGYGGFLFELLFLFLCFKMLLFWGEASGFQSSVTVLNSKFGSSGGF